MSTQRSSRKSPLINGTVTNGHVAVFDGTDGSIKDGGVPAGTGTVTNTGTLTANQVVIGNGGVDVKVLGTLGTTTTVLHGNAAGAPTFGQVALTTDVSGTLPVANGGTNSSTALSGSSIMISNGTSVIQGAAGTTATVLHGNVSGSPTYGAVALGSEVSGDLPFANFVQSTAASKLVGRGSASGAGDFEEITLGTGLSMSGTTLTASGSGGTVTASGTLTSNAIMLGAGTTVVTALGSLGTTTTVLHGNAAGAPTFGQVAISTDVSGLGSGVATFLATPSSANLASALTDETGSGKAVFDTAPTLSSTVTIGTAGGTTGAINLKGTTSGTVTLTTAAAAGTTTFKLPTADGSSGQVIKTDGSGQLSFGAPIAGSSGYQFSFIFGATAGWNPGDGSVAYFGLNPGFNPTATTDGGFSVITPITGNIKKVYGRLSVGGTLGSAGVNSTFTMRNLTANTTEDISTTVPMDAVNVYFNNTAMTLAVTAGDALLIKVTAGTWAVNPTAVFGFFSVTIA